MNPAHSGAAQLVPPTVVDPPLLYSTYTFSPVIATSGMLRLVVEPLFAVMLMPCCHVGIEYVVLIPPLLPVPLFRFHTVSET